MTRDDEWRDRAACRPDPAWDAERRKRHVNLFFPERGQSQRAGKKYCASCEVQAECVAFANSFDTDYGMWGGMLRSRGNHENQPDTTIETEEEQDMIPRSLSASSIQVYLKCPSRWKAEYIDYGRMPGGDAASIGTVCHTCYEVWVADGHYLVSRGLAEQIGVMKGIYDEAYWRMFGDAGRYDDGWKMVQAWLKRQDWTGRTVVSTESKESFDIPTSAGPIKFNFIMDRLDVLDDGTPEIVDYKSLSQPVQPQDLKNKPQCRIYALAVQLKYPQAEKIWMTFDMLRFDQTIGIVFTKEENRSTWKWLCEIAQRIVDDETPVERLNEECRWCVRKDQCETLQKHVNVGGPLSITDVEYAAKKMHEIDFAVKALGVQQRELEAYLLAHMQRSDEIETEVAGLSVKVTVSARRGIDESRLRPVIGEHVMAKYGAMTMAKLDELLKSDDIDSQTKGQVKALIQRNYGDPKIKVEAAF